MRRLQLLLKCADISNVVKPLGAAREWGVAVTDEFFAQVPDPGPVCAVFDPF